MMMLAQKAWDRHHVPICVSVTPLQYEYAN